LINRALINGLSPHCRESRYKKPSVDCKMKERQDYPSWIFYPRWVEKPGWVEELVKVFTTHRPEIDSIVVHRKSNEVLSIIRKDLEQLGYLVEGGGQNRAIPRPVYFGEYGRPGLQYQIDSYHAENHIALEVEAGRSTRGNAVYRDIIQTSLLVGVDYFVLAVPQKYAFQSSGNEVVDRTYKMCRDIFDALYAGERLRLPFQGVLLIGY
jgi:hypothetical protein